MRIEDLAALAALPEPARRELATTMLRTTLLQLSAQVRQPEDTNDHIVVRARQFESFVKRG